MGDCNSPDEHVEDEASLIQQLDDRCHLLGQSSGIADDITEEHPIVELLDNFAGSEVL